MLKSLRRLLKNFPAKGSGLKIAAEKNIEKIEKKTQNITENADKNMIFAEIQEIKQEMFAKNTNDELRLLGDLLKNLRELKLMPLLMICRQINKIEVKGNCAVIHSDDSQIFELVRNEKYNAELNKFFSVRGLGFKIYEKPQTVSASDILNEMLGGKLVIK